MAGALWIKEGEMLMCGYSSSDICLSKDDNIENKLMNTHTHTQADLPFKISLALLEFKGFALKQLSLVSEDLFLVFCLRCCSIYKIQFSM